MLMNIIIFNKRNLRWLEHLTQNFQVNCSKHKWVTGQLKAALDISFKTKQSWVLPKFCKSPELRNYQFSVQKEESIGLLFTLLLLGWALLSRFLRVNMCAYEIETDAQNLSAVVLSSDQNNTGSVDPTILDLFLTLCLFYVSFGFLGTEKYHIFNWIFLRKIVVI